MPELPEVEHLRRTLLPVLTGAKIRDVILHRKDIVRVNGKVGSTLRQYKAKLLAGTTIQSLVRHGKNLALIGENGHILGIHLGMTGQLRLIYNKYELRTTNHVHCEWEFDSRRISGRLIFRDARRFGGLWVFQNDAELAQHWKKLGPDALRITPQQLKTRLSRTERSVKAALLDQTVVAGIGNIYADESLFASRIDPRSSCSSLSHKAICDLHAAIRSVLRNSIRSGGSTFRDYVDSNGRAGKYAGKHLVYGRGSEPCMRCGRKLSTYPICQRTTVSCSICQSLFK